MNYSRQNEPSEAVGRGAVRSPTNPSATDRCFTGTYVDSMECAEQDCSEPATFELHIPWDENRAVCAGHARVLGRQDGVVADPLENADEELP